MVPTAYLRTPERLPKDQEEYPGLFTLINCIWQSGECHHLQWCHCKEMQFGGESPPTFMRPLLIRIYPSLGNNSFQDSEVAQLVIPAHCKCVDKSILELQIHLPKGEELTLCILTVKAEHRPKQKHLVCVGGNLGQWYRTTSHTLAGMCHTLKRVLNIRWDNRETLSQLAFCSTLSAHPTLLWMPLQYFPFGKILSLLSLPLIQWSSCRSPCSAGDT